jgi:hypothetical protein
MAGAVLLLLGFMVFAQSTDGDKVTPAIDAAKAWLALTDAGQFSESWDAASSVFRNSISRPSWIAALEGSRRPLGAATSRVVTSAIYATSLAGAPPGEYVVVTFTTNFDAKRGAKETVTPKLAADGSWKVSGYFIQ